MPISNALIKKIEKIVKKGKLGNELSAFQMDDIRVTPIKDQLIQRAAPYTTPFAQESLDSSSTWKTTHHIIPSAAIQRLLQTGILFYLEGDDQEKEIGKELLTQLLGLCNPIYQNGRKLNTSPEFFLAALEKLKTEDPDSKKTEAYLALVMKHITWSKANTYIGVSNLSRSRYHGGHDPGSKKLDIHVLRYYRHYLLTLEAIPFGLLDPRVEAELSNPRIPLRDDRYAAVRENTYNQLQDLIERCKYFESTAFKPLLGMFSSKELFKDLMKLKSSDTSKYQRFLSDLTQCSAQLSEVTQAPLSQTRLNRVSANPRVNMKRNTDEAIFIAACEKDHEEKLSLSLETPPPFDASKSSPFEADLFYSDILEKMKDVEEILSARTRKKRSPAIPPREPILKTLKEINTHLSRSFISGEHPLLSSEELQAIKVDLTEIYQNIRAHLTEIAISTATEAGSSSSSIEPELVRVKNKLRKTLNGLEVIITNMERQPAVIATPAAGEKSPLPSGERYSPFSEPSGSASSSSDDDSTLASEPEEDTPSHPSPSEEETWIAQKESEKAARLLRSEAHPLFKAPDKTADEHSVKASISHKHHP